ncbi:hypothetical protein BV20DRAFT_709407 [Pilatotrama ljubarskyi]|nr:hypothetical protein BV20DRAFT_709407 [Pilatotrama ljubarskyi]
MKLLHDVVLKVTCPFSPFGQEALRIRTPRRLPRPAPLDVYINQPRRLPLALTCLSSHFQFSWVSVWLRDLYSACDSCMRGIHERPRSWLGRLREGFPLGLVADVVLGPPSAVCPYYTAYIPSPRLSRTVPPQASEDTPPTCAYPSLTRGI